jgi:hypothetical protein
MTRLRWRLFLADPDRDPRAHRAVARRPAMTRLRWRLVLPDADRDRRALTAASSLGAPP